MTTATFDYMARLEVALNKRGNPVSADSFMDILGEINDLDGASKDTRINSGDS